MVRINGYEHGAVRLSKFYEQLGGDYLAVSNIEEAIQLRNAGVFIPFLICGYTDPLYAVDLTNHNITQCVFSYTFGEPISKNAVKQGVEVKIHIKLDTGMGRIEFQCFPEGLDQAVMVCTMPMLINEGICTHFASPDEGVGGKEHTLCQFNKPMSSIGYLDTKGIRFPIRHCANSAGILDYLEIHLDMVKASIVLYGLQPSDILGNPEKLHHAMTISTIIDSVKTIHPGDYISYGRECKAARYTRVASIPIGMPIAFGHQASITIWLLK